MKASNVTALREALVSVYSILEKIQSLIPHLSDVGLMREFNSKACRAKNIIDAALSAPPRNCDRRYAMPAEAHIAFQRFCRGNYRSDYAAAGLDGCDDCELCEVKNESGEDACPFWWLLASAKSETKGDANDKV